MSIDGKNNTYDALDRVVEASGTTQILYGPTGKVSGPEWADQRQDIPAPSERRYGSLR